MLAIAIVLCTLEPSGARAVTECATSTQLALSVERPHNSKCCLVLEACEKLEGHHVNIAMQRASICPIRKDGSLVLLFRQHMHVVFLLLLFGALDTSGFEAHLLSTALAGIFSKCTDQPLQPVSRAVSPLQVPCTTVLLMSVQMWRALHF
jgi:hypothetical protein